MIDFEHLLEQFYSRLDLKGAAVVDVGAHLGRHAIPLAKHVGIGGLLYAFEPIPQIRTQLCLNLQSAGLSNVVVFPFALANERRVAEFNYIPNLPEESGLKKRHEYNLVPSEFIKLDVGVFRLQDLIPGWMNIRFLKIDVEGGELDVLEGALDVIRLSRPVVAFECGEASFLGYHEKPDRIFDIFHRANYIIYSVTGEYISEVSSFIQAAHAQNFWDYIAFPAEQGYPAAQLLSG